MARGAISVGLSMVGVLLLGGCAGSAEAGPDPTPSVTAEPMVTPAPTASVASATAPVRPAEMDRNDEVGAVAAATYFVGLYNYAMATGDLGDWNRVSYQDCGFCENVRDDVTRVYGADGRFVGGDIAIMSADALPPDDALGQYPIEIKFSTSAGVEVDATGDEVGTSAADSGYLVVVVVYPANDWVLIESGAYAESHL